MEQRVRDIDGFLARMSNQLEDPDVNEQIRAVGELGASGDVRAYALMLNALMQSGWMLHRAVELAFMKNEETDWLSLVNADEDMWKQLIESEHPVLMDAVESRYVQSNVMSIMSQGDCRVSEKLLMRYFEVADKDPVVYEQALRLVETHDGSPSFTSFKNYLQEQLELARRIQVELCLKALSSGSESDRLKSVIMLAKIGDDTAVEPLLDALDDDHGLVRLFAVKALWRIGDAGVMKRLSSLLRKSEGRDEDS